MIEKLSKMFLFKNLNKEEIIKLMENLHYKIIDYNKGQYVYEGNEFKREIGIILKGNIEAQKYLISGKKVLLNQLKEGDIFGISGLFQEEELYISSLLIKQDASILFINETEILRLFQSNDILLKNYLSFVHTRIRFLNERIECFTHESIKERVVYFLEKQRAKGHVLNKLRLNRSEIADFLGISRASLYRILGELKKEKC
jgi:CRP-like cAMP-binding protein